MIKRSKRGISTIIATVLLILITIAAVGILWQVVFPLIKGNIEASNACMNVKLSVNTEGYTCTKQGKTLVQVSRGSDEVDLEGIQILLNKEGKTSSFEILQGKSYENIFLYDGSDVEIPGINEALTYQILNEQADSASVAPIVSVGKTKKTCSASYEVNLEKCSEDIAPEEPIVPPQQECGNNIIEEDEECDGTDLGEQTCESLGFDSGILSCYDNCTYDKSNCDYEEGEVCGNGICEEGETDITCPFDCARLPEPSDLNVWLFSSLEKRTKSVSLDSEQTNEINLFAAKNEYESLQVVIESNKDIENAYFELNDLKDSNENILSKNNLGIYEENFVNVSIVRDSWSSAGLWPDPLLEISEAEIFQFKQNERKIFLIDVYATNNQKEGEYKGVIFLNADGKKYPIKISLEVWNFSLPIETHFKSAFGYNHQYLSKAYNLSNPDGKYTKVKKLIEERFNPSFAEHRISPNYPQIGLWIPTYTGTSANFNFTEGDTAMEKWISSEKFNSFLMYGPYANVRPNTINNYPKFSQNYNLSYIDYYRKLAQHMAEKGWLGKEWIDIYDEACSQEEYNEYKNYYNLIKQADSRIKAGLAFHYYNWSNPPQECGQWEELDGFVDLWIANLGDSFQVDKIQEKRKKDEEVWLYLSGPPVNPSRPGPNYFIGHPSINQRIIPWIAYKYNVTGVLYWSVNNWATVGVGFTNTWVQPYIYQYYEAGVGFLYYPPCGKEIVSGICPQEETQKIVPSLRLKMIRDGMEDYEYLYLLKQKCGKNVMDSYVNSIITNKTHFEQDTNKFLEVRSKIAEKILGRC